MLKIFACKIERSRQERSEEGRELKRAMKAPTLLPCQIEELTVKKEAESQAL
jgi:hypothetical protein